MKTIDFEKAIDDLFLSIKENYPPKLFSAMEYAVKSGGKRIRPQLCFLSADFCDVPQDSVLPFALAIEFIHSYSLVHDDLPCMDNDVLRRGKPTVHAAFGEATALLVGDTLLNLAYETLFSAAKTDSDVLSACKLIAECAGGQGMIGGQALEFENDSFTENDLYVLDKKKTGMLIKCAVLSPAYLSGSPEKISALASFSDYAGLAFQIADDLIDVEKEEKTSFVNVCGKEKASSLLRSLRAKAYVSLAKWPDRNSELLSFFDKLAYRNI